MKRNDSKQFEEKSTLIDKVQKLQDKDAIKELWYSNCFHIDQGKVDAVMKSFAEDAIMDTGPFGHAAGRYAIREMLGKLFTSELLYTRHMRHNPIIKVNGNEAIGKWYADIPSITGDGKAVWIMGIYELGFRLVNGDWQILKYAFEFSCLTDFEKGWVNESFPEGMSGELKWKPENVEK